MSHPCARAKTGACAGTPMFTDTRPCLFMRPSEIWPAAKIAIDVRKLDGCQAFLPPIRRDRSLALLLRRTATFLGFLETGGEGGEGNRTFLEDDFDARLEARDRAVDLTSTHSPRAYPCFLTKLFAEQRIRPKGGTKVCQRLPV